MDPNVSAASTPPGKPAFGIFEGGGAKGVAHVGALAAAEKNGVEFIGVAGSSAGAMIATLIAAGYEADEIMSAACKPHNILARYDRTPTDLFGDNQWRAFQKIRRRTLWLGLSILLSGPFGAAFFPRTAIRLKRSIGKRGFFATDGIDAFVNTVLRDRLMDLYSEAGCKPEDVPERITFSDLDPLRFPRLRRLKIVASDMDRREYVIFSRDLTPHVAIASAVCASIAIPGVFRPVRVDGYDGGRLLDGGLVSNLPVWIFAEEKLAFERANPGQEPVPIIAFSLTDPPAAKKPSLEGEKLPAFLYAVGRTAVFGGQSISQRFIDDVIEVQLPTPLSILDFGVGWRGLRQAYLAGKRAANQRLRFELTITPALVRDQLEDLEKKVRAQINAARNARGLPK